MSVNRFDRHRQPHRVPVPRVVALFLRLGSRNRSPIVLKALRQLARDHPHLVRVALGDLRQHLEILVGEELRVGIALVDRLEDGRDRLRLALGGEDRRLLWPSALRIADCFSPSAVRICACLMPSAWRIAARFSRSARICFSIVSLIVGGGSTDLSSTRLTRIPHLPVASSRIPRSWSLIVSRRVSVCSRSCRRSRCAGSSR